MKKADFWKSDWFFGVVVSIIVLVLGNGELLQGLERKAYDMGVAATSRTARTALEANSTVSGSGATGEPGVPGVAGEGMGAVAGRWRSVC